MKLGHSILSLASVGAILLSASSAFALNDYNCQIGAGKFPIVIAHGQAGTVQDMTAIVGALEGAGYCVYGETYGIEAGGSLPGRAHLDQAGGEFAAVVDKVLNATRATKVDTIGYSEGGMVVDNFILKKGGAPKVNRFVGFAPGHHPYAHFGIPKVIDGVLFAPNVLQMVRDAVPPFTSNISITDIIKIGLGFAPGLLQPQDQELVESEFVADLFDANYWISIHGSISEPQGTFANVGSGKTIHTYPTKDSAPNICYTNMITNGDMMVGASAGFLDDAPNVQNVVLASFADHVGVISDQLAIKGMLDALNTPCTPAAGGSPSTGDVNSLNGSDGNGSSGTGSTGSTGASSTGDKANDDDDLDSDSAIANSGCGCRVVPTSNEPFGYAAAFGLGLVGFAVARRRTRSTS